MQHSDLAPPPLVPEKSGGDEGPVLSMTTPSGRGASREPVTDDHDASAPGLPRRTSTMQILRAAEGVFARSGFGATTMSAIADAAGLPKANLHYYFRSKELLYRAVLEDILSTWLGDADVWIVAERTPREGLTGYIRAKMAWTRSRADASRIFAGELLSGAAHIRHFLEHELRTHVERMDQVLGHWTRSGLMQPVATRHLLFCIWAMTQSYADFSPQMEAVLGRSQGLRSEDYEAAGSTILRLVLAGCGIGEEGLA